VGAAEVAPTQEPVVAVIVVVRRATVRLDLMPLSREELVKTLGDVEGGVIAEILAIGSTAEELAEARAWITNDER
jgi:hypothetical protein